MNDYLRRVPLPLLVAALGFAAGCKTTPDSDNPKTAAATATPTPKPRKTPTTMRDEGGDVAFQSFLGRLRQAVAAKDVNTLAGMMTTNFGYHINPDREGDGVFAYWDQNNVWPELQLVVHERFVPFGSAQAGIMVAPADFAAADRYTGYRAGVQLVNGSWKFAYFVNGGE